jgi:hypothetical protein
LKQVTAILPHRSTTESLHEVVLAVLRPELKFQKSKQATLSINSLNNGL